MLTRESSYVPEARGSGGGCSWGFEPYTGPLPAEAAGTLVPLNHRPAGHQQRGPRAFGHNLFSKARKALVRTHSSDGPGSYGLSPPSGSGPPQPLPPLPDPDWLNPLGIGVPRGGTTGAGDETGECGTMSGIFAVPKGMTRPVHFPEVSDYSGRAQSAPGGGGRGSVGGACSDSRAVTGGLSNVTLLSNVPDDGVTGATTSGMIEGGTTRGGYIPPSQFSSSSIPSQTDGALSVHSGPATGTLYVPAVGGAGYVPHAATRAMYVGGSTGEGLREGGGGADTGSSASATAPRGARGGGEGSGSGRRGAVIPEDSAWETGAVSAGVAVSGDTADSAEAPPPLVPLELEELWELLAKRDAAAAAAAASRDAYLGTILRAVDAARAAQPAGVTLLHQYRLAPGAAVHRGRGSVVVPVWSAIDGQMYSIKYYGDRGTLAAETAPVLAESGIATAMPAVRAVVADDAASILSGRCVVAKAGRPLDELLAIAPRHFMSPHALMHFLARFAALLDTLHAHQRIHGNLTPHHVIVDTSNVPYTFTFVDLSASCKIGDARYAAWGSFDVQYAAPEVVAAALTGATARIAPAADLWTLGMLLFELATGGPYWSGLEPVHIAECLLRYRHMPHGVEPGYLSGCGALEPVVRGLLSHDPTQRMRVPDLIEVLALRYARPIPDSLISDRDALQYIRMHLSALLKDRAEAARSHDSSRAMRKQLAAIHHLLAGQELLVTIQIWEDAAAARSEAASTGGLWGGASNARAADGPRRPCPVATGLRPCGRMDGRAGWPQAALEPVLQLTVGQTYYLTCIIQNRDPTSLSRMPFKEVTEVRVSVAPDRTVAVKPKVRESGPLLWWGESVWVPSHYQDPVCQDVSYTSEDNPATIAVALHMSVPYLISPLKLRCSLKFNLNPTGSTFPEEQGGDRVLDPGRSPGAVKRETIGHGMSFITSLGGNATGMVHSLSEG